MALETPPRFSRGTTEGRRGGVPRGAGEDAVPRGLAVASAVMLRLLIVVGGPVVVGRRLRLHPVAILLALTTGGVLAGVAGAFLTVPAVAVGAAVLGYVRERRAAAIRTVVTT